MIRSEREASNKGVVSLEGQGIKRGILKGKEDFQVEESMETGKWSCGPPFFMYITGNAKLSQALLPVRFEPQSSLSDSPPSMRFTTLVILPSPHT